MSMFVIINEWTDVANNTSSEVVDAKYFESEDDAWEALRLVAVAHDVNLDHDDTSLILGDSRSGIQFEEYYIQELTKSE